MSLPAEEVVARRGGDRTLLGLALLAAGGLWLFDEAGVFHVTGRTMASAALVCIGAGLILKRRSSRRVWPIIVGGILALSLLGSSATSNFRQRYGGSFGSDSPSPTTVKGVLSDYRTGFGTLNLDLTGVPLTPIWHKTVHVDVGFGTARITVPDGLVLRVNASTSAGSVRILDGRSAGGVGVSRSYTDPGWDDQSKPHLTLDVSVEAGQITIARPAS